SSHHLLSHPWAMTVSYWFCCGDVSG
ncbi:hypothetical protein VN97_g1426, partial [Penicillium thymicola]